MCLRELCFVCPFECLDILLKGVALDACSDFGEEKVHRVVVVELEEGP